MSKTQEVDQLNNKLKERIQELEDRLAKMNLVMQSQVSMDYTLTPVMNFKTEQIELYGATYAVTPDGVYPNLFRAVLNYDNNTYEYIPLEQSNKEASVEEPETSNIIV